MRSILAFMIEIVIKILFLILSLSLAICLAAGVVNDYFGIPVDAAAFCDFFFSLSQR